jgi:DNA-binding transcriptional MocR family regulator
MHSPTTIRTTLARKQEIADLARRHNITIIEDDCHGSNDAGIPACRAILPEQSYYLSSLTKSVSGALRLGFCVAPPGRGAVLRQVAQSAHYGVSQPITDICTDLILLGAGDRIWAKVAKAVVERARITVNLLGRWDIKWREDASFVYLTLPQGWRASRFMVECERLGILVKPADEFALTDARPTPCGLPSESAYLRTALSALCGTWITCWQHQASASKPDLRQRNGVK